MNNSNDVAEALKTIFDRLFFTGVIRANIQNRATEPVHSSEPLFVRDVLTIYRILGNIFDIVPDEMMLREIVNEEVPTYVQLALSTHATEYDKAKARLRFNLTEDYFDQMVALRREYYPTESE